MAISDHVDLDGFIDGVQRRNPGQPEFVQAVTEVAQDIFEFIADKEDYHKYQILRRIAEPDRVISFRVVWEDDNNNIRVQRGWRVQNNNAIGPYKGGIRFHPSVNESVLKFLAFEQTFKNALTGLPMGGAKGGANFNPKGKSIHEIMRFCQSFMTELYRHRRRRARDRLHVRPV
jgi:glutamate dehydrogenase (NADP+)